MYQYVTASNVSLAASLVPRGLCVTATRAGNLTALVV
uniref:Uncharacterized protein n=1 Tax=Timema genevievae TaxID=629358 RepID=A0A7R9K428_TIMGE|nr:unnamed protein product [Timema genevievae]